MTEDQLVRAEAWAKMVHEGSEPAMFGVYVTVHDLTAEVRRLRGLIRDAERNGSDPKCRCAPSCPWCGAYVPEGHEPDCKAFAAECEVK